jgi:hypothetical protein
MNNKQDEINHLKHLHMEYKKKYNSKKQTIEEENKTITESNSSNQLNNINNEVNPKYNRKTYDKDNNASKEINITIENKDKNNKTQTNNTLYSLSEHVNGEEEKNKKIISKKPFPLHKNNFLIEKKEITESDNNLEVNKEATIEMKNVNKNLKSDDKIKIKLQIDKNMKRRGSEFVFDSRIKNKLLYEFKQSLDEKISELKKKLNLTNLNTETDNNVLDENTYNKFIKGKNNLNPKGFTNNDNHLAKIIDKNNLENSKNFKKKTINMLESFDFNSVNMEQASVGQTININNNSMNVSLKDSFYFKKKEKINFDKFMSIKQINNKINPYLILLSFLNTKDIFQIFQSNKKLRELFITLLKQELTKYITDKFKKITKNLFDNYSFYIGLEKNLPSKELKIYLILKAKIISEHLLKKSLSFQYFAHFPCDESQYVQNTFLLDIKSPPLYYWAMKESTNFNQDELNKAYFMNVMQYTIGDYVEFTLNIFTEKGLMDIRKLVWNKITVFKTPNEDFLYYSNENILKREIVDFDVSRYCEMELCKGKWNDIILLDDSEIYISELINKFKNNFHILKILFDNVGYYIFKFYLEGIIPGVIGPDEEIGMKITILDQNEDKSNETKKNNLVFDRKNEIQMHVGDSFIFYISKNVEIVAH